MSRNQTDHSSALSRASDFMNNPENPEFTLSMLTPGLSFVSEAAHNEIISFLSTIPPKRSTDVFYEKNRSKVDMFFLLYSSMCGHDMFNLKSVAADCDPNLVFIFTIGPVVFSIPPPFQQLLEEYLLFYVRKIQPFFARIGHPFLYENGRPSPDLSSDMNTKKDPRVRYVDIAQQLGVVKEHGIVKRWNCGLARPSQFQIAEIAIRKMMEQLEALMELEFEAEGERIITTEFSRICQRTFSFLDGFVFASEFRSERLEALLLRYLNNDEVNMEFVRALDTKHRKVENDESYADSGYLWSGWY
ncbi:hypothetical protein BJ508DRAFT_365447 [Ascobolus immersus RN42]|uniref:Uncharacterized protein n=1 Tax=Ascobolus immersus RN42 TaxID=1160509 RepID=A0A3N4HR42_ASCIM|nr:hypothetical protein BJ508DRAFT_365447 [Ascobolus immersus RN42]